MTDIIIPGTTTISDASSATNKIPAGEKVLVIKTPKGVYIRTSQGKIFAVRTAPKPPTTTTTASPPFSSSTTKKDDDEVMQIDDDDDEAVPASKEGAAADAAKPAVSEANEGCFIVTFF